MAESGRQKRIEQVGGMFMLLMWLTSRRHWRILQNLGLTAPQFMTLSALHQHRAACTMTDLVNISPNQDPATMTGIIDRLVKQGWAERCRSTEDRRVVLVSITPAGKEAWKKAHAVIMEDSTASYQLISDKDLEVAWRLLKQMLRSEIEKYDAIKDSGAEAQMGMVERFMRDPVAFVRQEHSGN